MATASARTTDIKKLSFAKVRDPLDTGVENLSAPPRWPSSLPLPRSSEADGEFRWPRLQRRTACLLMLALAARRPLLASETVVIRANLPAGPL